MGPPKSSRRRRLIIALVVVALLAVLFAINQPSSNTTTSISLSRANAYIQGKTPGIHVTKAIIDDQSQTLTLTIAGKETKSVAKFPIGYSTTLANELLKTHTVVDTNVQPAQSWLISLIYLMTPVLIIIAALFLLVGRGSLVSRFGRGRGIAVEVPETRFKDVAGSDTTVEELAEVVSFLHEPSRYLSAGARLPRGFLLVGPPGTGKTLLARAVAGEAGVPFFALSGAEFVEAYVGVGAARVRQVFERAKAAGRAIIFIDEIDAVGRARSSGPMHGGVQEHENTLVQLLSEMDGFAGHGVILLAATNRPDVLDPALTRPGRFDRVITVPAPDRKARLQILELYTGNLSLSDDVDLESLARRTPGMTGADISQLTNEAALEAARRGENAISSTDIESALTTTVVGRERRSAAMTEHDQRVVANHEAGHAVISMVHPHIDNPVSVSIIPRGASGGHTWMGGTDDAMLTRSKHLAGLVALMGGRAGEMRLLDGDFTQGAVGDIRTATQQATEMIASFGMGTNAIAYRDPEALAIGESADDLNREVNAMLADALSDATRLLEQHGEYHTAVARELLAREVLQYSDLVEILESVTKDCQEPRDDQALLAGADDQS
jgi:cell division protease FtsH